jgi:hypothetical protein
VAIDHGLLDGVKRAIARSKVFDGKKCPAIKRRQELDTRIDCLECHAGAFVEFGNHDGTRAAVTFGAAFLGARALVVLAQVLEHGACGGGVGYFVDGAVSNEADGLRCHVKIRDIADRARVTRFRRGKATKKGARRSPSRH